MNLESSQSKQSIISFVSLAVISAVGFLAVIIFSNLLGAELMGVYYLFFTYLAIFELIGNGGIGSVAQKVSSGVDSAVQKFVAEGNEQNEYYSAYFVIRLAFTVIATVLMVCTFHLVDSLDGYLPFLIGALFAGAFSGMITSGIRAKQKISWYSIVNLLSQLVYYALAVVLVCLGYSLGGIFGGYIAGLAVLGALSLIVFRYRFCRFTKKHVIDILKFSIWSIIIGGMSVVIQATDTFLIDFYLGDAEVGIYRVALHVTLVSLLAVNAVNTVIAPRMSRCFAEKDNKGITELAKSSVTYGLMLAVPAAFGGILLAHPILYALYGTEFSSGAVALKLLLLFQVIMVLQSVLLVVYANIRRIGMSCVLVGIGFAVNLVLDIILIPRIGINGAALASLVSAVVSTVLLVVVVGRYQQFVVDLRRIINICAASVMMCLAVYGVKWLFKDTEITIPSLFAVILCGAVVYVLVLLLLDKEVRKKVLGFIRRN